MLLQNRIATTHYQSCIVIANSELCNLIITHRSSSISEALPPRELLKKLNNIIKCSPAKNLRSCVTANRSKLSQPSKSFEEIPTSSESVANKSSVDCRVTSDKNLKEKFYQTIKKVSNSQQLDHQPTSIPPPIIFNIIIHQKTPSILS